MSRAVFYKKINLKKNLIRKNMYKLLLFLLILDNIVSIAKLWWGLSFTIKICIKCYL